MTRTSGIFPRAAGIHQMSKAFIPSQFHANKKEATVNPLLVLAILSASLIGTVPAMAQDGGPDPHAPTAYAGTTKEGFYDVERRMENVQMRIQAMGRGGARAMAEMRQIRAFIAQQKARHNGELLDWDRETINLRLDQLVGRYRIDA
jgi:hypothetical protein